MVFSKIIEKIEDWKYRKEIKKKRKEEYEKNKKIINDLENLLAFVKWLNTKGLKNRKERKIFWNKVSRGERLVESIALDLLKRYKEKVKEEENNG